MTQTFWLGFRLTRRDLSQRYRGTVVGVLWPFLYAGLMLSMFTFVFSLVLNVRWSVGAEGRPNEGALMIFAGLVPYLFIAEVMTRSASCITSASNFVKKVRFPLSLLPVVVVNSALVLAAINALILVVAVAVLWGVVPPTVLMLPLIFVPLAALGLGVAFLFATLGVFFRDLSQVSPLLAQLLMFLAPVCYPASAVPPAFARVVELNPVTWFATAFRDAVLDGEVMAPGEWASHSLVCVLFALATFALFRRTRRSFADVL
ncbi:lipopolysaccharide transport system permease protein [Bradyrhizobium elkanii]|uniref:ABC transporter permease n=1 Tax=Bradyrhizobium TaxID=374 RepID=UPI0021671518|nr:MULTISPECIES: ABC transporter permease [Bradyrhizobium]MCS3926208.1 lipopolysaccharide transport system permease protein [Bradyrhizobium elkanii]MCS3966760.1 lipopolysaccharide transport system permease protein [Bradyrhizobium japonicum]